MSKGRRVVRQIAEKEGILAKITFILECIDMFKDWVYLFALDHAAWAYHLLIASIVLPFAVADYNGSLLNNSLAHNFLIYIGLTDEGNDKYRRVESVLYIAALENIPQFIIVVCEIFQLKQSVTFNQAGNPIFALLMTYKAAGPVLGSFIYYPLDDI